MAASAAISHDLLKCVRAANLRRGDCHSRGITQAGNSNLPFKRATRSINDHICRALRA